MPFVTKTCQKYFDNILWLITNKKCTKNFPLHALKQNNLLILLHVVIVDYNTNTFDCMHTTVFKYIKQYLAYKQECQSLPLYLPKAINVTMCPTSYDVQMPEGGIL